MCGTAVREDIVVELSDGRHIVARQGTCSTCCPNVICALMSDQVCLCFLRALNSCTCSFFVLSITNVCPAYFREGPQPSQLSDRSSRRQRVEFTNSCWKLKTNMWCDISLCVPTMQWLCSPSRNRARCEGRHWAGRTSRCMSVRRLSSARLFPVAPRRCGLGGNSLLSVCILDSSRECHRGSFHGSFHQSRIRDVGSRLRSLVWWDKDSLMLGPFTSWDTCEALFPLPSTRQIPPSLTRSSRVAQRSNSISRGGQSR